MRSPVALLLGEGPLTSRRIPFGFNVFVSSRRIPFGFDVFVSSGLYCYVQSELA